MSKLIERYYQTTSEAEARRLQRGQFCWGPGLYLPTRLTTLELVQYEPRDERRNRYAVVPDPPANLVFNHTPVHELNLEHDEELLVIKAKRRLLVVVSQAPAPWALAQYRLRERAYACLPLYSFHREDLPEFRARVKALEYPWWIYLPEDSTLRMREGFIRLDRMQVVEERLLQPTSVALTEEALFLASEWLRYYLTEEIDPLFLEDRRQLLQELQGG